MTPPADHRSGAWDIVPDALLVVDRGGTIIDANDEAIQLFGSHQLVGRSVEEFVPDEHAEWHPARRGEYHETPRRRSMGAGVKLSLKRADGTIVPAHIALSPLPGDCVLAAVRDVSETVAAESRLIDATRRRILAEDHERIARDLHDRIIQSLFALGMNLQAGLPSADPTQDERVSDAVDTLDDIIRSIRDVIFDVRRNQPDDDSLLSHVVEIAAGLIPSLGFEPTIEVRGAVDGLNDEVEEHLLAVVRESLANVARHAQAASATVEVIGDEGRVIVRITDDGTGLPSDITRHSGHANMAARARIAGGSFRVATRPSGGTVVEWEAPATPRTDD